MEITEIRIKLMERSEDRLRGFCSITIENAFVIRDLKIIDGTNGPFVAMPSRKLTGNCQRCRHKNHLRSNYCNHCGSKLQHDEAEQANPQKLYADVAHPINSECREEIQRAVLAELEAEIARCQQPGYRSKYDDDFDIVEAQPKVSELLTPTTADPNDLAISQKAEKDGSQNRQSETQTADDTPACGQETGPQAPDSASQSTRRVDSEAARRVPAPMRPNPTQPNKQTTPAAPEANDNDSFGAGIF